MNKKEQNGTLTNTVSFYTINNETTHICFMNSKVFIYAQLLLSLLVNYALLKSIHNKYCRCCKYKPTTLFIGTTGV